MRNIGFIASVKRSLRQIVSRPIYLFTMVALPLIGGALILTMMEEGLPQPVPVGLVDMDHSELSRKVSRTLDMMPTITIENYFDSFDDANRAVKSGEILGFIVIEDGLEEKAVAMRQPEIVYYSNFAFYVPASLVLKGFKTSSTLAQGGLVKEVLVSMGMPEEKVASTLVPVKTQMHGLGNPWMNYAIYLGNSFLPCMLALVILLITSYTITVEIKHGTSVQWLADAKGSMFIAILGKLLPQTLIFFTVGIVMQAAMYLYYGFPLNCNPLIMALAMLLLVVATQSLALIFVCAVPNLRLALSVCALLGMLSFSIGGFSFPVSAMYPAIGIFSYIVPIRYYFLIYVDQALNGIPLYYSRLYFAALLVFPLLSCVMLKRLRKACEKPVYVP